MDFYYLASRKWLETEILAGNAIRHRLLKLPVDFAKLDQELATRAEEVRDATEFVTINGQRRVCVLDSGIDPELEFGSSEEDLEAMDEPIVQAIGWLPELSSPTDEVLEVVEAWEAWIDRYKAAARQVIEDMNEDPPLAGSDGFRPLSWGEGVDIEIRRGFGAPVRPSDGVDSMLAARAGKLWNWASARRFSSESIEAAREAVGMSPGDARRLVRLADIGLLSKAFLKQAKKLFAAAKAYDRAIETVVPGFDVEMNRWAFDRGSNRLRLGLEDGYRMNSRYLAERLACEAPGMFAMPTDSAKKGWAIKAASPSESALRLRRRIAAAMERNAPPDSPEPATEIVRVRRPPHEVYLSDPGIETEFGIVGSGLPSRDGWPWSLDPSGDPVGGEPRPFEAVIVKEWLGRFHLVGAVNDEVKGAPPGIWAVPDVEDFRLDGSVVAHDPDEAMPERAKRKPPEQGSEDDIPF